MRLGIGTWSYAWAVGMPSHGFPDTGPGMGTVALLDRAAALGVGVVQVADNMPLELMTADDLDRIDRCARGHGIEIEVGTRGSAPEHLRTLISIAQRLGASMLRVVVDRGPDEPTPDEVVRRLEAVSPDLSAAGVRLAIENHDRFRVAELAGIVRRLGGAPVGICLDTVNSLGALEGPDIVIRTLAPLAINVHCKDVRVRRAGHTLGFVVEGTAAGDGQLDIPALLRDLREGPSDPNIILELWTPPEATWRGTIEREDAWVTRSVVYLRTLLPT